MDRIRQIIISAERTAILKHIEKYNKIHCKELCARISVEACEINSARAWLTKRSVEKDPERKMFCTNALFSCIDCKRFKRPGTKRIAQVISERNSPYGKAKRNNKFKKEGDISGASSEQGIVAKLYDKINEVSSLDNEKDPAIESYSGKYRKGTQSNDIYDVGIPVEIDEVYK